MKLPFRKVRVLQLGSPMGLYGAERWILALVRHLDPAKVESIVAAIKDTPAVEVPICREAQKFGIQTRVFEAYGKINMDAVRQLRRFLKDQKIHILHTHGYKQDFIGLLASRGTKSKLITTPHGWSTHGSKKLKLYESINRCLFPFFDAVVPLSKALYRPLQRYMWFKKRLMFIVNGVDLSEVDAVTEIAPRLAEWRNQGSFVIGYIGQLIHRKGLDVLLRAVSRIEGVNWRLAILGTGEQEEKLRRLSRKIGITDKVEFFGYHENRLAFLRGFDVFVLPSILEGIPRCLMEALVARLPVIASDIPGCNELIKDNITGRLFPVGDEEALTAILNEMIVDRGARERMGKEGRKLVEEQFSAYKMSLAYQDLYFQLYELP